MCRFYQRDNSTTAATPVATSAQCFLFFVHVETFRLKCGKQPQRTWLSEELRQPSSFAAPKATMPRQTAPGDLTVANRQTEAGSLCNRTKSWLDDLIKNGIEILLLGVRLHHPSEHCPYISWRARRFIEFYFNISYRCVRRQMGARDRG